MCDAIFAVSFIQILTVSGEYDKIQLRIAQVGCARPKYIS